MADEKHVGVGVAAILVRSGKVLLGRRLSPHGQGDWGFPGGKLEFGETIQACAIRETYEETGLKIKNPKFAGITNDLFNSGKHYVTIFLKATCPAGTPKIMEPTKTEEWQWFTWDNLPNPLFLPIRNLIVSGLKDPTFHGILHR